MLKGNTKNKKRKKHNSTKHQTSAHGCSTGTMRGWVGWHSTVSWKEAAIGRAKKGFSDSDNSIFGILTWNGIKERWRKVQETKVNSEQRSLHVRVKQGTEHVTWDVTQMWLVKTILQPHKFDSSTTKHLEPAVLKQKQTTRKTTAATPQRRADTILQDTPQQVTTTSHIT